MKSLKPYYFFIAFFVLVNCCSFSQPSNHYREKIYIHTDKKDYIRNDTLWLQCYIVDALNHLPTPKSGYLYIFFIDDKNEQQQQLVLPIVAGVAKGDMPLDTLFFSPGKYKMIAYTNWMQNFGDSLFYQKEFTVSSLKKGWLANISKLDVTTLPQDSIKASLQVQLLHNNGRPQDFKALEVALLDKKNKPISADTVMLDKEGKGYFEFLYKNNKRQKPLYLQIGGRWEPQYIQTPINTDAQDIDLQFLPESGHLVAGFNNTIGFKAIDQQGKGIHVKGIIKDQAGQTVTAFQALHKGMGIVSFIPQPNKKYTAHFQNGRQTPLPPVENSGTILHVASDKENKKIYCTLKATADKINTTYTIVVKCKGYQVYSGTFLLKETQQSFAFAQNAFPTGVSSVTLQTQNGQLINQRAFFVNNDDTLQIKISPHQPAYHTHDSIALHISVSDADNQPVEGIFSIAVTDDSQVKKDPLNDENILSSFLLQSDIRGVVEVPGYYFSSHTDSVTNALDALLLTQGFVNYDWDSTKFKYRPEKQFQIRGSVKNGVNKPVAGARVSLASTRKTPFADIIYTDEAGRFVFDRIPRFDTISLIVQANNKKGGWLGLGLELEKFKPANLDNIDFAGYSYNTQNINLDSSLINASLNRQMMSKKLRTDPQELEEVIVRSKVVKNSYNLNGPGKSDQLITRDMILKIPREKKYFGVLEKYATGYVKSNPDGFLGTINGLPIFLVIDGICSWDLINFYNPEDGYWTAPPLEEIKAIEIMTSGKNRSQYLLHYMNTDWKMKQYPNGAVFLEITTLSGEGWRGFAKRKKVNIDQYLPLPFYYGRSFYSPKYEPSDTTGRSRDLRATVYWQPNVVTNQKGAATASFFAAHNPATYTLWIEGIDMNGNLGRAVKKIIIE